MIFDVNKAPVTDNEYQQRLLAMAITLVKAAGGRIEVPPPSQVSEGMTYLTQELLPSGGMVLTVQDKPRTIEGVPNV